MTGPAPLSARSLRIGTRASALALAQTALVAGALAAHDVVTEIVTIETAGDRRALDTAWGEGAFVSAIESALIDGRIDVAVHSAKDVPTDEDGRLSIAAYLPREEPRDALVLPAGRVGTIEGLPAGSVIGTDSPRRTGFIRAFRPDLEFTPLHGNVDTRLRRLDEGAVDALVLAAAGLLRLGRGDRISQLLPLELVPPAAGQGAIAVQVRTSDLEALAIVGRINDRATSRAVAAERWFLRATGGGCRAPIGALATIEGEAIQLLAGYATLDGSSAGMDRISGPLDDALTLAAALAERLVTGRAHRPGVPRVLVTRPGPEAARLAARLAELDLSAVIVPTIEIELCDNSPELDQALLDLASFDWLIVTSANGARALDLAARRLGIDLGTVRFAAVGRATARELARCGVDDVWLPGAPSADQIGRELPVEPGQRVLWARGDLADEKLDRALVERGAVVTSITAYRTVVGPASSRPLLDQAMAEGPIDAVIVASPSAVRGLFEVADASYECELRCVPVVCVGERTASAARDKWHDLVAVAPSPEAAALAALAADLLHAGRVKERETVSDR